MNSAAPVWPNRDRFVLSIRHISMLLYSLIHLSGVRASAKTRRSWANDRFHSMP